MKINVPEGEKHFHLKENLDLCIDQLERALVLIGYETIDEEELQFIEIAKKHLRQITEITEKLLCRIQEADGVIKIELSFVQCMKCGNDIPKGMAIRISDFVLCPTCYQENNHD